MGGGVTDTDLWVDAIIISGRALGSTVPFDFQKDEVLMVIRGVTAGAVDADAVVLVGTSPFGGALLLPAAAAASALAALFASFRSFFRCLFSSASISTAL